jgi:uncharacterized membrane protein YcaP (DUF421 family)
MGTPPLTWEQMSMRGLVALAYGIVILRLFGRRIFARWSALDIVIAVSMGSTLSRAITGPIPFWPAVAATTVMILVHRALAILSAYLPWLSRLLEGREVTLAKNGVANERSMAFNGITFADLAEALRMKGLESISQTQRITLEPNGGISIQRASDPSPPSAANAVTRS